ncbi:MAG: tetratricopeptide repeat protein [Spirochaetes bacterium]|nr:tetratricopeptide repeat protein [Spirochaetota bacterium]
MKTSKFAVLLLACIATVAFAATKEIKVTKVTGQVRILQGSESAPAMVGQVLPAGSTIKTYTGAQLALSIDGTAKVISENRTVPVSVLAGGDSGLENATSLIGKLTARGYTGGGASSVAGVRGAEQGKKGSFGVQWQGQAASRPVAGANATSDLDQARALCEAQDFEGAIAKLNSFIAASNDDQAKARAQLLLAQADLELARSADALKAADAGLKLAPKDAAVSAQLRFAAVSAAWFSGKADAAVAAVDVHFPASAAAGDEYWNAQVIKVLALKTMGNKSAAKKLKAEVSTACPNDEIVAAVAQISL